MDLHPLHTEAWSLLKQEYLNFLFNSIYWARKLRGDAFSNWRGGNSPDIPYTLHYFFSFLFFVVVVVFVWVLYFEATLQSLCRKDCRRGSSRRRCRSRRTFCTRTRLAETKTYIWMLLSPFRITSGDSWYQLLVFLFCELLHSSAATHGNWFEKFDCQKNNPNFEYAKDKRTVYKPSLLSIGINRSWGLNAQYMTLSIIHGSLQLHPESQWRTSSTQEYKFQQGKCLFDCWKSGDLYFILAG